MKKIMLIFSLVAILSSCNQQEAEQGAIKKNDMDLSVDPGTDFYQYAVGGWMKNNPLPASESRYGAFDELAKSTDKKVKALLKELSEKEQTPGSVADKIGRYYSAGMDIDKINEQGMKPLKKYLDQIEAVNSTEDVQNLIVFFHKHYIRSLFGFYGGADRKNSEFVIVNIGQGGLGLADVSYYTDENFELHRKKYKEHMAKMLQFLGEQENKANIMAERIFDLELRLAQASMTRLERRNPNATYNKMQISELQKISPNFNWTNYFSRINLVPGDINVQQPKFFAELSDMLNEISIDDWKAYFKWNLISSTASYLSDEIANESFDFYGKFMRGQKEQRERWERVLDATNGALGNAIGQLFVQKHFPPEAKERMDVLVANLMDALSQRINQLEWMGEETKLKAKEKLSVMNVKIGYPDKWRDYSDLELTDSYLENAMRSRVFSYNYNLDKIYKPVDKDEWFMNPHTVNAYYSPSMNEMCFPAGILQAPFFYLDADDAVNYGAIGVVIGHEMTHGFDDQGRLYNKDGNLEEWWTKEDAAKFDERAQVLVKQFNEFKVLDDLNADGNLSLGENIADLGGLNISLSAYKKSLEGRTKPEDIDGFTDMQRFFLAYAKIWAQNITEKEMVRRTKEDVHSLGRYRVLGPLRNMPEFHEAFGIKEGAYMFLPEDQRAAIW